jgi:hypothetical protein
MVKMEEGRWEMEATTFSLCCKRQWLFEPWNGAWSVNEYFSSFGKPLDISNIFIAAAQYKIQRFFRPASKGIEHRQGIFIGQLG